MLLLTSASLPRGVVFLLGRFDTDSLTSPIQNIDITFEWPGEAFSCSSVLDLIEAGLAFLPEIEIFSKAADVAVGLAKPCCESDGCGKTGGDRRKRMLMD